MFDPFKNRSSRDIRNQLSEAFLSTLKTGKLHELEKAADGLRTKAPETDHIIFIDDRVRRYGNVFDYLFPRDERNPSDPFDTARCLWEKALFFECHEWLEALWQNASGMEKKALQGLIRAAGAFVLNEAGRHPAAGSSAQKARMIIQETRDFLPPSFDADHVVAALDAITLTR